MRFLAFKQAYFPHLGMGTRADSSLFFRTRYLEFKNFSFVFPTWSIPVEMRGSIIVYTTLMALARSTRDARLWCQGALIFYFMYVADGWYGALFLAGTVLCELDLLAKNDDLPHFLTRFEPYKMPIFYAMFAVAMYLSGVPSHLPDIPYLQETPGWYYLSFLKPEAVWDQKWFYLFWAAVCLIAAIPRIGWLKAFFECSFNQYLGRISFALYLVHGPVLWTLADRLYAAVGWYRETHEDNVPEWVNVFPCSEGGPLGLEPRFLVPHIVILPLTLWLSEIVMKLCDEPVVRFSRWMYTKTLPAPKEDSVLHG